MFKQIAIIMCLSLVGCVGAPRRAWNNKFDIPEHLVSYGRTDFERRLRDAGFDQDWIDLSVDRNAAGTKIICSSSKADSPKYIVRAADNIKKVESPGYNFVLDDEEKVVSISELIYRFSTSSICRDNPATSNYGTFPIIDRQAKYIAFRRPKATFIFEVNDLENPIAVISPTTTPWRIDIRNDKIYFLESTYEKRLVMYYRVFGKHGSRWRQDKIIEFPPGLYVVDMDTRSGLVLLSEQFDFFPRRWYLYDESTTKLTSLGPIVLGVPFFLENDVLGCDRLKGERAKRRDKEK
jgi:hypothetical protein